MPFPLWGQQAPMDGKERLLADKRWLPELQKHPFRGPRREPSEEFNSRLCIIKHDITKLRVGAIVNAANSALAGGSGLDAAVHCGAGPGVREELKGRRCDVGSAVVTNGHKLPCQFIYHAVAPIGGKGDPQMESCYDSCLKLAARHQLSSLAFCCLGTGIFRFPRLRAAHIALSKIRDCFERAADPHLVVICTFEKADFEVYRWLASQHYFPLSEAVPSSPTTPQSSPPTQQSSPPTQQSSPSAQQSSPLAQQSSASSSAPTLTRGVRRIASSSAVLPPREAPLGEPPEDATRTADAARRPLFVPAAAASGKTAGFVPAPAQSHQRATLSPKTPTDYPREALGSRPGRTTVPDTSAARVPRCAPGFRSKSPPNRRAVCKGELPKWKR